MSNRNKLEWLYSSGRTNITGEKVKKPMLFLGLPPTLPNLFHDSAQGPDGFIRVPLLRGSLHSTETDGFIMSLNKQINNPQAKKKKSVTETGY